MNTKLLRITSLSWNRWTWTNHTMNRCNTKIWTKMIWIRTKTQCSKSNTFNLVNTICYAIGKMMRSNIWWICSNNNYSKTLMLMIKAQYRRRWRNKVICLRILPLSLPTISYRFWMNIERSVRRRANLMKQLLPEKGWKSLRSKMKIERESNLLRLINKKCRHLKMPIWPR